MNSILRIAMLVLIVGLPIAIAVYVLGQFWVDGPTREQGVDQGNLVVAALEHRRQDTGSYPSDLRELVPRYLSEFPRPAEGQEYFYDVCADRNSYVITFALGRAWSWGCSYSDKGRDWRCGKYDTFPLCWYYNPQPSR